MEVRPGYKATEVGVIPEEWEVTRLAEITEPQRPISYGIVQTGPSVISGVPCLRVMDINDGKINKSNLITTTRQISDAYKRTVLKNGDLVMPLRGKVGDVGLIDRDLEGANLTRGVALIAVCPPVSASFCRQLISCSSTRKRLEQTMNGSALQEIPIATLRSFQVGLPSSHAEQSAIAATLDDVDALLSGLDRLIAKKRDLKQAAMQQLLTGQTRLPGFGGQWSGGVVGNVVEALEAGVSVNSTDEPPASEVPSVLKTSAVSAGTFIPEECKRITHADVARARLNPLAHTILVSRMNTPDLVGDVAYVPADYPWLFLPDRLWMTRFRPGVPIDVRWLAYLLSSRVYQQQIKAAATGTSGSMKNISKDSLLGIPVLFPEYQEQTAIATVLTDIDLELAALEARRDKTRLLKQGMMQELLTGKTRLITPEAAHV